MAIELVVNGRRARVTSSPDTPLLYVLRDELGVLGPKFGCGLGQCGTCTVLADDSAMRSCVRPVSQVEGQHITTVEGLAEAWAKQKHRRHVALHPIQQAWIEEQVPQCGYCQNGMMMAAANLLAHNPNPSESEIKAGITNLCRCGTYDLIIKAVQRAAQLMA